MSAKLAGLIPMLICQDTQASIPSGHVLLFGQDTDEDPTAHPEQ